jgi:hypothetical protein
MSADVVGGLLDGVGEYCIAGQIKDQIDSVSSHHAIICGRL